MTAACGSDGIARVWGSTPEERALTFPGDAGCDPAAQRLWRAVGVAAPAATVFRWLCQLRVAPYSYDWIDNRGRRSPATLTPGLERLERGQTFMSIFRLVDFEPGAHMTLEIPAGSPAARLFGAVGVTYWARAIGPNDSRLLVKLRVTPPRSPFAWLLRTLLPWGDLVMMRRQLLNLKALAEGRCAPAGARKSRS